MAAESCVLLQDERGWVLSSFVQKAAGGGEDGKVQTWGQYRSNTQRTKAIGKSLRCEISSTRCSGFVNGMAMSVIDCSRLLL